MRQRLTAWFYLLLAAVVCLSAANGSVLLCLHAGGALHAPVEAENGEHAEPLSTCEQGEPCCRAQTETSCVDLQIDGLDLDFSVDQAKAMASGAILSDAVHWSELLPLPSAVEVAHCPTRGPPGASPRIHVSVPTTVLHL
ncbi:hypothetical protein [Cerasicoccus frondis]|uniref:hypothetical protein n=1 Tax=Cerasicoccus frondis TaxID=490090 RepID=UPI002852B71A|nr:hypothetical protein [Cerasicoccus frondis]